MSKLIFKGFKQVTSAAFNEAKANNGLAGYFWLVRTPVADGDVNDVTNDEYDIYFGSAHYGHFKEGEIAALQLAVENLRSDLGFNFGEFSFEGATTVKDAFDKVSALFEGLVTATETNANKITAIEESLKNLDVPVKDVQVDGVSVVDENGVANIVVPDINLEQVEGAIDDKINAALNKFATEITDNNTIDTFRELVDYAAEHTSEIATLVAEVGKKADADKVYSKEEVDELVKPLDDVKHAHENKEVLDGITAAKVEKWDAAADVDATKISLGEAITADGEEVYGADQKLSSVLQGIQDSISVAVSGGLSGVVAGNGIEVSGVAGNKQTVSAKVSVDDGNMLSIGSDGGLFAAMYYDGDDVEE